MRANNSASCLMEIPSGLFPNETALAMSDIIRDFEDFLVVSQFEFLKIETP